MNELVNRTGGAAGGVETDAFDELPLPYIEMDAMGVITGANRATLDLHPLEHGALIGRMAWDLMATDEKEPSCAAYMSLMKTGEEPSPVLRSLYTRGGEFRTYEMHRSLIRDGDGKPAGMRMVCVDVTRARRELEVARQARAWLEGMLESAPDAVIVTDALGLIRAVNPAAEGLLGWKESELKGKVIEKGMPLLRYESESHEQLSFARALERRCRGMATILDRERRELRVEIASSPIVDKENGSTIGVLSVLRGAVG